MLALLPYAPMELTARLFLEKKNNEKNYEKTKKNHEKNEKNHEKDKKKIMK